MTIGFGEAGRSGGAKKETSKSGYCPALALWRSRLLVSGTSGSLLVIGLLGGVAAQTPITSNGPPQEVIPQVGEVGMPNFTIPSGTTNPFGESNGGDGSSTDTSGGGDSGGGDADNSDVLNTMISQPWGITAVNNSEAVGVNPSALAATCVLESSCGANTGTGSAQGAFQMYPAAFQEGLQTALATDPSLASQIVQGSAGMNDPTTEAISASGYLMQATQALQEAGISNPTVVDARSYYEFGPNYGVQVASAQGSMLLSSILPASFLSSNGISSTETVAQWQAGVASKIGNAANQSVLM